MQKMLYEITNFKLDNDSLQLAETLFHNANGYLGVRSNFEEGYPADIKSIRGTYINGFYDFAEMKQAEKLYGLVEEKQTMLNVVDTEGIRLFIDDEEFSMFSGTVLQSTRQLDMAKGITTRKIKWLSMHGKEVEIKIVRMASFNHLSLFTIEYQVTLLNCDAQVKFVSTHIGDVTNYFDPADPRVATEVEQHLFVIEVSVEKENSFITAQTAKSNLLVCSGVRNLIHNFSSMKIKKWENTIIVEAEVAALQNKPVSLVKYTILTDSIRFSDPRAVCRLRLAEVISTSLQDLYAEQELYLTEIWKNFELDIVGDDELNLALKYNIFQLIQSVTKDEYGNIAAKGLSGEGYEGHYFWDTEMFVQPFFVLTKPEFCKNLIAMRYKTLDKARENARIMGYTRGVLFPWRTIMGRECSGHYPSGTAQEHINGDIAYSVVAYYLATGDFDFMEKMGAELLFEIARHWIDLGNYYKGNFLLNCVTGPDEYTCLVNNNYYTNSLAKYSLYWAVKIYNQLVEKGQIAFFEKKLGITREEIDEFIRASENMMLPYNEELKINPQDDSFLQKKAWDFAGTPPEKHPLLLHFHPLYLDRYQVCKQADTVMSHFILEDYQNQETIRNSFNYYEKITTHDSSLSTCIFSIMASRIGYHDKALKYFGDSAKLDLFDTHHNTKDGIHTANMGGNYMVIVYGFAGLRLKEEGLFFSPYLPEKWDKYSFSIQYFGNVISVAVEKKKITFLLSQGNPVSLYIFGNKQLLEREICIQQI